MRILLFGELTCLDGYRKIDRFPTHRAKVLLAYLAYHREAHPRNLVAEMLWPGANPDAIRLRLNQTVAEIRRTLATFGDPIISNRFTLRLDPEVETDLDEFYSLRRLTEDQDDANQFIWALEQAARIAKLPFLHGIYEDWAVSAADHLSQLLVDTLHSLVHASMAQGRWPEAMDYSLKAAEIDPYSETLQQNVIHCLLNTGRRVEAVRKYREYEALLRDDFAIEPSDALRSMVFGLDYPNSPVVLNSKPSPNGRKNAPKGAPASQLEPSEVSIDHVLETYIGANDADRAMRLASALIPYWNLRGELTIARRRIKQIFSLQQAMLAPPDSRCLALVAYGLAAISMSDFKAAEAALSRAYGIATALNQPRLTSEVLRARGQAAIRQQEWNAGLRYFELSLVDADDLEDLAGRADSLTGIGEINRFLGRYREASSAHAKARELRFRIGRADRAAHSTLNLGIISSRQRRFDVAIKEFREALSLLRSKGSRAVLADCLMEIAGVLANQGQPKPAAQLLAAVSSLRESISAPLPSADRPDYVRFLSKAREQLDREAFATEWERGKTSDLEGMIDLALGLGK